MSNTRKSKTELPKMDPRLETIRFEAAKRSGDKRQQTPQFYRALAEGLEAAALNPNEELTPDRRREYMDMAARKRKTAIELGQLAMERGVTSTKIGDTQEDLVRLAATKAALANPNGLPMNQSAPETDQPKREVA